MNLISKLHGSEHGQTTIEFGLILVFVSIAMIASLLLLAGGATGYYDTLADALAKIA